MSAFPIQTLFTFLSFLKNVLLTRLLPKEKKRSLEDKQKNIRICQEKVLTHMVRSTTTISNLNEKSNSIIIRLFGIC